MNCREFKDDVHEYLDETLGAARQTAAREHLAQCAGCRQQLQRVQFAGRALQQALDDATAEISLSPDARREILEAARAQPSPVSGWRETWTWITAHPLRLLAPVATLAIVLWFSLQLRHI